MLIAFLLMLLLLLTNQLSVNIDNHNPKCFRIYARKDQQLILSYVISGTDEENVEFKVYIMIFFYSQDV